MSTRVGFFSRVVLVQTKRGRDARKMEKEKRNSYSKETIEDILTSLSGCLCSYEIEVVSLLHDSKDKVKMQPKMFNFSLQVTFVAEALVLNIDGNIEALNAGVQ